MPPAPISTGDDDERSTKRVWFEGVSLPSGTSKTHDVVAPAHAADEAVAGETGAQQAPPHVEVSVSSLPGKPIGATLRFLSKRPHFGSTGQQYQFDATVHSLYFESPDLPAGTLQVRWTRGSKSASTRERSRDGNIATFGQRLTLAGTLFSTVPGGHFATKLCSFALVEEGPHGLRVVATCKVDLSPLVKVRALHTDAAA